jgi:septum site-determining protein MinC
MTDNLVKAQAFKLKGRLYTLTVLQLCSEDQDIFDQQLAEVIAKAPRLFYQTPVILDCSLLQEQRIKLADFCNKLRAHNILPIAVQGAASWVSEMAQSLGLAVLHASTHDDKRALPRTTISNLSVDTNQDITTKTKLVSSLVRSGQQILNNNGDLIVAAPVSHGAELLATGNIHIYGTLRGRALAGITGDQQARIFCLALDAELVSIAGCYSVSDNNERTCNSPCQIYLHHDQIHIEPLC